eukprot:7160340-Prymnesium_polylepis.2
MTQNPTIVCRAPKTTPPPAPMHPPYQASLAAIIRKITRHQFFATVHRVALMPRVPDGNLARTRSATVW